MGGDQGAEQGDLQRGRDGDRGEDGAVTAAVFQVGGRQREGGRDGRGEGEQAQRPGALGGELGAEEREELRRERERDRQEGSEGRQDAGAAAAGERVDPGEVATVEKEREVGRVGAVGGGRQDQRQRRDAGCRGVGADRGRGRAEPVERQDRRLRHGRDRDAVEPERAGGAAPGGIGRRRRGAGRRRQGGGQPAGHQERRDGPAGPPRQERGSGARAAGEDEGGHDGERRSRHRDAEREGGEARLAGSGEALEAEVRGDPGGDGEAGDRDRPAGLRGQPVGPERPEEAEGHGDGGAGERPPGGPAEETAEAAGVAGGEERGQDAERQLLGAERGGGHHQDEDGRGDGVGLEVGEREGARECERQKGDEALSRDCQRGQPAHPGWSDGGTRELTKANPSRIIVITALSRAKWCEAPSVGGYRSGTSTSRLPTWLAWETTPASSISSTSLAALL